MQKSSIVCEACGSDNVSNSEFCINCGSKILVLPLSELPSKSEGSDHTTKEKEGKADPVKAIPFWIVLIFFLTSIDTIDDGDITWAFYPIIPIVLFFILLPLLNKVMNKYYR
ncbi:MAG: hypothetical protein ACW99A_09625 [Candidatus Kariarchaeaceae archaeon]|jgi:quinol-cytochrome oxidoreductase complex cytochrome b subunit